jgi:hypothetical protein
LVLKMPLYRDEETIRSVWELKRKHPDWRVRRIGEALNISKDKVQRILRRIEKGEIEITESGKVMDGSKPRGIVAYQQMAKQTLEPSPVSAEAQVTPSDPLEALLKSPWNIECDKCGKPFSTLSQMWKHAASLKVAMHTWNAQPAQTF